MPASHRCWMPLCEPSATATGHGATWAMRSTAIVRAMRAWVLRGACAGSASRPPCDGHDAAGRWGLTWQFCTVTADPAVGISADSTISVMTVSRWPGPLFVAPRFVALTTVSQPAGRLTPPEDNDEGR